MLKSIHSVNHLKEELSSTMHHLIPSERVSGHALGSRGPVPECRWILWIPVQLRLCFTSHYRSFRKVLDQLLA